MRYLARKDANVSILLNSHARRMLNLYSGYSIRLGRAGRDTTASLLSWLFAELGQHPEMYTKLRQHILEDFGDASSDLSHLSFTKLKSCRYLQHVILETLRLHPPVPFNNRQALRDTTIPIGGGPSHDRPVAIGKGQIVTFSVYALHRRKDLWGEDANEFKPERMLEERIRKLRSGAWKPFGNGTLGMKVS